MTDIFWFVVSCHPAKRRVRTWCFWRTKEEAVNYVKSDAFLLSEDGHYTHVLIEAHEPAPSSIFSCEELWFKFDGDTVIPCMKPVEYDRVVNFAIG